MLAQDEELESIQNLVSYVERALKLVSDELANGAEEATPAVSVPYPAEGTNTAAHQQQQQQQRMLKGVMRVGLLAKGLLLKGDRIVQLVVLCSQPPTFQLLETVAKALPAHLTVSRFNFIFKPKSGFYLSVSVFFLIFRRLWLPM